ncbi:MAG: tetratricopeptide repeat protein [Phycisphaerales bacterium]
MNATKTALVLTAAALLAGCTPPASSYREQGEVRLEAGQYTQSIENYEKYLELRPGDNEARFNLAKAYMAVNEPAKAATNLRIVHTQVPNHPEYTELLAESLLASGRRDELYRLLKSEAMDQQTMSDWLRLGQFALRQGDKDTALVALLASAKVDGGRSYEPHVALYDYYRSMGQKPEAIRRIRMAAWVAPRSAEVQKRIKESGEVNGPTFPLRPAEWDARMFDPVLEPVNPFKRDAQPAAAPANGATPPAAEPAPKQ